MPNAIFIRTLHDVTHSGPSCWCWFHVNPISGFWEGVEVTGVADLSEQSAASVFG
jgi:hypothetical protein